MLTRFEFRNLPCADFPGKGPVLASTKAIPDPSKLRLRGLKNGKVMQSCGLE